MSDIRSGTNEKVARPASFAWFVWQVLQLTTYTVNAFNGTIFLIIQLLRLCSTGME